MDIKQTNKSFYILMSIIACLIISMGIWWSYLIWQLSMVTSTLESTTALKSINVLHLIKWEGPFFILTLFILVGTLYVLFIKDYKRVKNLNHFLTSLTRRLKTPLSEIKINSELLMETDEDQLSTSEHLQSIQKNAQILDDELNQFLELAYIENLKNYQLQKESFNLKKYFFQETEKYKFQLIDFDLSEVSTDLNLFTDAQILMVILRNIVHNAIKHQKMTPAKLIIKTEKKDHCDKLSFINPNSPFTGDVSKLGNLFYRHNSPRGAGIGLYIIKTMAKKIKGKIEFNTNNNNFIINLTFEKTTL